MSEQIKDKLKVSLNIQPLEERVVPAITVNDDTYNVRAGRTLQVGAAIGVVSNDTTDQTPNFIFARQVTSVIDVRTQRVLSGTLQLSSDGSFFFRPPRFYEGTAQAIYSGTNIKGETDTGTITFNVLRSQVTRRFAIGADAGGEPTVRVFDAATKQEVVSFNAYAASFTGGVRVAVGDLNDDGIDDIVTVPGNGGSVHVKIFDGSDFKLLGQFFAIDPNFRGGGYVTLGDIDGDLLRNPEIIIGAGEGGGPRVNIFRTSIGPGTGVPGTANRNLTVTPIADFFAFGLDMRAGARVATGYTDVNAGETDNLLIFPGFGGGPELRIFEGTKTSQGNPFLLRSSFVSDLNRRDGLYVAAADLDQTDQRFTDELIVVDGAGRTTIRVLSADNFSFFTTIPVPTNAALNINPFDAKSLNVTPGTLIPVGGGLPTALAAQQQRDQTPNAGFGGGIRIAVTDSGFDGVPEILLGSGPGDFATFSFLSSSLDEVLRFRPFPEPFNGGIFVAGSK